MSAGSRVKYAQVDGAAELFTDEFVKYLAAAHDEFTSGLHELRVARAGILARALDGDMPKHSPAGEADADDWRVPPVPDELQLPGIEISGPASLTSMFINALNPGPDGRRAVGDLDDDEDSGGHRLVDTVAAALNRRRAVEGTLRFEDVRRGRTYEVKEGPIPFFMHRERGIHLDEHEVTIDGIPVPAALLGTALTLFHAGRAQIDRGQGLYWYLPQAGVGCRGQDSIARLPGLQHRLSEDTVGRRDQGNHPRRVSSRRLRHGANASRSRSVWSGTERRPLGPQGEHPRVHHGRPESRLAGPVRGGYQDDRLHRQHLPKAGGRVPQNGERFPIGGMATALPDRDPQVNEAAGASIARRTRSGRRSRASCGDGWLTSSTCRRRRPPSRSCGPLGGSRRRRWPTLGDSRCPWRLLKGL